MSRPIGKPFVVVLGLSLLGSAIACPISRPSVPPEYYDFRAQLQAAVTDTAMIEMDGLRKMQDSLEARLPDLAAILTVDSLLAALDASPTLSPLAGATATTVRIELNAKNVGGGVRNAFRNPDGQRQAVDAIVIGLGKAVRVLRTSVEKERASGRPGRGARIRTTASGVVSQNRLPPHFSNPD